LHARLDWLHVAGQHVDVMLGAFDDAGLDAGLQRVALGLRVGRAVCWQLDLRSSSTPIQPAWGRHKFREPSDT
jgi:hypothetical protein